jgi:hypothetical protein
MPWPTQTECERGDSNPHARRHQLLRLARLPIPALSRDLDASRMTKGRREGPDGESLAASGIPSEELTCAPRSRRVRAGFNPGDRRAVRVPLPGCRARARHADHYLEMSDGVRIAVTIRMPNGFKKGRSTRRSSRCPATTGAPPTERTRPAPKVAVPSPSSSTTRALSPRCAASPVRRLSI